jgi:hypothetical protein
MNTPGPAADPSAVVPLLSFPRSRTRYDTLARPGLNLPQSPEAPLWKTGKLASAKGLHAFGPSDHAPLLTLARLPC